MKKADTLTVSPEKLARQLGRDPNAVRRRVRKLFPEITKAGVRILLNTEQAAAVKQSMTLTVSPEKLAKQLGCGPNILRRCVQELFPGITKFRETTLLNAEQAAAVKKRIAREDGCLNITEAADLLGVHVLKIKKCIRELFPEFTQQGKTLLLNTEQVAAIKKLANDEVLTIRELAKRLGCHRDIITKCVHDLFPGLVKPKRPTFLSAEQAALIHRTLSAGFKSRPIRPKRDGKAARMSRKSLREKLIRVLKLGTCFTQSQIARELGITEDHLRSLMKGHQFVEYELSDDEKDWTYWPELGVYMKKSGDLVIIPHKKTARTVPEGMLLRYPQHKAPLQRGLHHTGGIQ
jgi:biotin operon repressor